MLNYSISPSPRQHLWHIVFSYDHISDSPNIVKLANWVAGSYIIRDFSRHIVSIHATRNGVPISIVQRDKNTWKLPEQSGQYEIYYSVYANDLSVRASLLDTERGFIDGACLFLYHDSHRAESCSVEFLKLPDNWHIHTTLPRLNDTCFQAASYTELTDHPFEMGANLEVLGFTAHDIPHRIVLSGYYPTYDRERFIADCKKICEHELSLFPAWSTSAAPHFTPTVVPCHQSA